MIDLQNTVKKIDIITKQPNTRIYVISHYNYAPSRRAEDKSIISNKDYDPQTIDMQALML